MAWDDDKGTAADPENPTAAEQLTADEWDNHVTDQKGHAPRHEKGGSDEATTFGDTTHDSVSVDPNGPMAGVGEVQTAIDAVSASGDPGIVKLRPGVDYGGSGDFPWEVKSGVTLDYNGAFVDKQTDTDVLHVHPDAPVRNPRHILSNITFTSTVFVYDATPFGSYSSSGVHEVMGGVTVGTAGEGTAFDLHQNGTNNFISWVRVNHTVNGIGTCFDMHSEASDGWINANEFYGIYRNFDTHVHQHGPGDMFENYSFWQVQPTSNTTVGWLLDGPSAANNYFDGKWWDFGAFTADAWEITANAGAPNVLSTLGSAPADSVTDSLGNRQNQLNGRSYGEREDRHHVNLGSGDYFVHNYFNGNIDTNFVDGSGGSTFLTKLAKDRYEVKVPLQLQGNELRNIAKYSDDANASNDSLYYDTTDAQLEYKDDGGTIHPLG